LRLEAVEMSIKARMFTCGAFAFAGTIVSFSDIPFVPWCIATIAVTAFFCGMTIWYLIRMIDEKPLDQTSPHALNAFGSKPRMNSAISGILGAYTGATVVSGFIWLRLRKIY
jgi:hypothetical protein